MTVFRWYLHGFWGPLLLFLGQALLLAAATAKHDAVLGQLVLLFFALAAMAHTATVWIRWHDRR